MFCHSNESNLYCLPVIHIIHLPSDVVVVDIVFDIITKKLQNYMIDVSSRQGCVYGHNFHSIDINVIDTILYHTSGMSNIHHNT